MLIVLPHMGNAQFDFQADSIEAVLTLYGTGRSTNKLQKKNQLLDLELNQEMLSVSVQTWNMDRHVDVFFNRIRGRDMHWNLYDLDVFFRNVFDNWHMVMDWNLNWIMDRFVNGHVNMLDHRIWCWNLKISKGNF